MSKKVEALRALGFSMSPAVRVLADIQQARGQLPIEDPHWPDYIWYVHEGDLLLAPEQVKLLEGACFLVKGNLMISGLFDYGYVSTLVVLGDVRADSLLLSCADCYFGGMTHFRDALISMGGSGNRIHLEQLTGRFVYNDSDSAVFAAIQPDQVEVCFNPAAKIWLRDSRDLLQESYVSWDEKGKTGISVGHDAVTVEVSSLCRALQQGLSVFR